VNRAISFLGFSDTIGSGYGGDTLQAFAEAGWRIPVVAPYVLAPWVEPFVGVAGVDLHTASFVENPGPASLVGASQNYGYEITTLGFRAEASLFASAPIKANAMIAWRRVFGDETPTSTLAFVNALRSILNRQRANRAERARVRRRRRLASDLKRETRRLLFRALVVEREPERDQGPLDARLLNSWRWPTRPGPNCGRWSTSGFIATAKAYDTRLAVTRVEGPVFRRV
jgi:Autotransporter beta-domain